MTIIGIDPSFRGCGVSDGKTHFVIATEKGGEEETHGDDLKRRCREITQKLLHWVATEYNIATEYHDAAHVVFYVEGPSFNSEKQGSGLYGVGWQMASLHALADELGSRLVEVPPATLKKWATGKGNTPKDAMKLAVYKRFGVEFENDLKCDKLFAFLLAKFGEAVESGVTTFAPSPKRGDKRRKTIRA